MVSKVASDQAKPNGVLWILPGQEARFLAPLDVRKIPGVGKVTEKHLHQLGIRKVGDLASLDTSFLEERFGKWGLALAGKAQGADAGGWFDGDIGEDEDPKSVSHEHTFDKDTTSEDLIDTTLAHLTSRVARRLREHHLYARTVQLKLRYQDFSTLTRAHTLDHATQLDTELLNAARALLYRNWKRGRPVRLIGVQTSSLETSPGQLDLLDQPRKDRLGKALDTIDRLRDKYGDSSIALGISGTEHLTPKPRK
jgi:DNA polymerase-4